MTDDKLSRQLHIDYRTGAYTAIQGARNCAQQRSACSSYNRRRARGILEADPFVASSESVSIDVWEAAFKRIAAEWQLPLVSLEKFGITHDIDGFRSATPDLETLPAGAEACPYYDKQNQVVYKLFDLRRDGSLGMKLSYSSQNGEYELISKPARLRDTVEKISLLNEIGAHPTEIVGLSDDGFYLIVKQPHARRYQNFESDRKEAISLIKGVIPVRSGLRGTVCLVWLQDQAWFVGDLHKRNIMRDGDGHPTIIDALTGPVPPTAIERLSWLRDAIEDAQALRLGLPLPKRKDFNDVDDNDL